MIRTYLIGEDSLFPPSRIFTAVCDDCGATAESSGYLTENGVCTTLPSGWSYRFQGRVRQHLCSQHGSSPDNQ